MFFPALPVIAAIQKGTVFTTSFRKEDRSVAAALADLVEALGRMPRDLVGGERGGG